MSRGTRRVASVLALLLDACASTNRPAAPKREQIIDAPPPRLIGEVCLNAEDPGPHVVSYFDVRGSHWTASPSDEPLLDGLPLYTVFALDGRRDAVFRPSRTADSVEPLVVYGEYLMDKYPGLGPCALARRVSMAECQGCGLAVMRQDSNEDGVRDIGKACVEARSLVVDIDGDGKDEAFSLEPLLYQGAAPEHIDARPRAPTCSGMWFASWQGLLRAAKPGWTYVDILGVADFDGDGRREVVIAVRSRRGRSIAVYRAEPGATRLERIALVRP